MEDWGYAAVRQATMTLGEALQLARHIESVAPIVRAAEADRGRREWHSDAPRSVYVASVDGEHFAAVYAYDSTGDDGGIQTSTRVVESVDEWERILQAFPPSHSIRCYTTSVVNE